MRAELSALLARAVAVARLQVRAWWEKVTTEPGAAGGAGGAVPSERESQMVRAAFPLLDLTGRLVRLEQAPDPDGLHYNLIGALRRFQGEATAAGLAPDQIRLAHFVLCATVDAAVLATAWGRTLHWETHGLLATFHRPWQRNPGLEGVLQYLLEESEAHPEETALARFCLLLGPPDMASPDLRAAFCRPEGGGGAGDDGGRPEGGCAHPPHRPLASRLPLWTAAVASEGLLLLLYLLCSFTLDGQTAAVLARLEGLLPATPAELVRVLPVAMGRSAPVPLPRDYAGDPGEGLAAAPAAVSNPAVASGTAERRRRLATSLGAALARDIANGNVAVLAGGTRSTDGRSAEGAAGVIRLPEGRLFVSGQATVTPNGRRLLLRVAAVLERESSARGTVIHVAGHTDDNSPRGLDLSEARAQAVAAVLRTRSALAGRVGSEGRGGTEPLPPASAPLGRQGRVDILVRDRDGGGEP